MAAHGRQHTVAACEVVLAHTHARTRRLSRAQREASGVTCEGARAGATPAGGDAAQPLTT